MPNLLLSLTQKKKICIFLHLKGITKGWRLILLAETKVNNLMLTLKFLNLCLKLLLGWVKILNLSPFVIIVILLVILDKIVLSWGLYQPLRLDLLPGSWVALKLLMFVTIVVFLDTLILIALSCILKSKCPNSHRFPLKDLYLCLKSC